MMNKATRARFTQAAVLFGVLAALMAILPALTIDDQSYFGYDIIFGKELVDLDFFGLGSVASAHLVFNIWALLAYGLPLVGAGILMFSPKQSLLSVVAFVASIILIVMLPQNVEIKTVLLGNENFIEVDWSLAYGALIAMLFSGLAGLASLRLSLK